MSGERRRRLIVACVVLTLKREAVRKLLSFGPTVACGSTGWFSKKGSPQKGFVQLWCLWRFLRTVLSEMSDQPVDLSSVDPAVMQEPGAEILDCSVPRTNKLSAPEETWRLPRCREFRAFLRSVPKKPSRMEAAIRRGARPARGAPFGWGSVALLPEHRGSYSAK